MTFPWTAWTMVALAGALATGMASCTLLAPTGSNVDPAAFPTPVAGVLTITHTPTSSEVSKFAFQVEGIQGASGTVNVESTQAEVAASIPVGTLGLEPGVHKVNVFEGDGADAVAEKIFVVPVPDASATP